MIAALLMAANCAFAVDASSSPSGAGLVEHLGQALPRDVRLRDEHGHMVRLGDLLGEGKPLVLIPGYYRCPMLCGLVLDGMARGVRGLGWVPGSKYRIASFSFDAGETPLDAEMRQEGVVSSFSGWEPAGGHLNPERWPFLVGSQPELDRLMQAIGLRIARDGDQIAHPAIAIIATADGRISRYLYGIEFPSTELRLALVEASDGRIGDLHDRLLLYCYHWDPASHRYGWAVVGLMRIGGLLTLIAMGLGGWWIVHRSRSRATA